MKQAVVVLLFLVSSVCAADVVSIDPIISARMPSTVRQLASFDASADSTRSSVIQAAKSIASSVNSTFNTITSNSFDWNNGNIANLTTFMANFTTLVQSTLTQPLDTGIEALKTNVDSSVTDQVNQLAQVFSKVYTNISDTNSTMASNPLAQGCISRNNASLLSMIPAVLRLGDCIQLENGNFGVIRIHVREAINKAKDNAVRSMNHLQLCQRMDGACVQKVFDSFENRYERAVNFLTLVGGYSSTILTAIGGRITDCMTAVAAEIESQVQTTQANFNDCMTQCCGPNTFVVRTFLPQYFYQWVVV